MIRLNLEDLLIDRLGLIALACAFEQQSELEQTRRIARSLLTTAAEVLCRAIQITLAPLRLSEFEQQIRRFRFFLKQHCINLDGVVVLFGANFEIGENQFEIAALRLA